VLLDSPLLVVVKEQTVNQALETHSLVVLAAVAMVKLVEAVQQVLQDKDLLEETAGAVLVVVAVVLAVLVKMVLVVKAATAEMEFYHL
jgi:hypothetical protein